MAALLDDELVAFIHNRLCIAVFHSHLRQRRQDVQTGHAGRGFLDTRQFGRNFMQQIVKELAFQDSQTLVCAQDLVLQYLQILGDVPLRVGQRLLADKICRHLVRKGTAHLDVITEHPVVADLQRADARFLLELCLQRGKVTFAAVDDVPQLVHLGVVARVNDASVLEHGRRILVDRCEDQLLDIGQFVDISQQRGDLGAAEGPGQRLQAGQLLTGGGKRVDFPRRGRTVHRARHQALDVKYL